MITPYILSQVIAILDDIKPFSKEMDVEMSISLLESAGIKTAIAELHFMQIPQAIEALKDLQQQSTTQS